MALFKSFLFSQHFHKQFASNLPGLSNSHYVTGEFWKYRHYKDRKFQTLQKQTTSTENLLWALSTNAQSMFPSKQHYFSIFSQSNRCNKLNFYFFLSLFYKIANLKNMLEFYYYQVCRIIHLNQKRCLLFWVFFFRFSV